MAIGARPPEMLRMVVGESLRLVGYGLAIGIPADWAAGGLVGCRLYKIKKAEKYKLFVAVAVLLTKILIEVTALRHE